MKKKFTFSKIDEIKIDHHQSWKNKIFLTIDIEWASDFVIDYLIDFLEKNSIKASFFLTHNSKSISRILKNKKMFCCGLHPNYNNLLNNKMQKNLDHKDVFLSLKKKFKIVKSVRAHCLTQNTNLLNLYKSFKIKYVSNELYFMHENVFPFKDIFGLIHLPIIWADDVCLFKKKLKKNNYNFLKPKNLNILCFHPTTFFLNSNNYKENYRLHRKQKDIELLKRNKNKKFGIRDYLTNLINKNY